MTRLGGRPATNNLWLAVLALAIALASASSAVTYADRLSHHAGFHLVSVTDSPPPEIERPRRTVFALVDGLGRPFAEGMESTSEVRARGQCRPMRMGPITVSRPTYAMLSTGLEQDRTGCRSNNDRSAVAAQSLWEVARASGLRVKAVSTLVWWRQLFPRGFDVYDLRDEASDAWPPALEPLTLIHPLYVDIAGHEYGAASREYAAAVARADRELLAVLEQLDLERDLLVITADHGHTSYGGHGGQHPDVSEVLTCFAGRGVARTRSQAPLDPRVVAPSLAVLLGVPFPRTMRAADDSLDQVFSVVDASQLDPAYVRDRRASIARFRAENRRALQGWLGPESAPTWSALYARERRHQILRALVPIALLLVALAGAVAQGRLRPRRILEWSLWATAVLASTAALYSAVRGSLDLTSVNSRWAFIGASSVISSAAAGAASLIHRLVFRSFSRLGMDWFLLAGLEFTGLLLHGLAFGWPMRAPLPNALLLFAPYLMGMITCVHALIALVLCLANRLSLRTS